MKHIISLIFIFLSISVLNAQEDTKQDTIIKPLVKGKLADGAKIDYAKEKNKEDVLSFNNEKITRLPLYTCSEDLDKDAQKKCILKYMNKHVARKFNAEIAVTYNLPSGRHRIYCYFTFSKDGTPVDIEAYSKYQILEEEAKRVMKLLPKTNPAMINDKSVAVIYSLPIAFSVE